MSFLKSGSRVSRNSSKRVRFRPDPTAAISARAARLLDEQYELLNNVLMPALAERGIVFLSQETWSEAQAKWLSDYFVREVEPVLSPLALDPARPFPKILN